MEVQDPQDHKVWLVFLVLEVTMVLLGYVAPLVSLGLRVLPELQENLGLMAPRVSQDLAVNQALLDNQERVVQLDL